MCRSDVTRHLVLERGTNELKRHQPEVAARATGGIHYRTFTSNSLRQALDRIGAELHGQHILVYEMRDDPSPGFHKITVKVARDGVSVRTRPGYFVKGPQEFELPPLLRPQSLAHRASRRCSLRISRRDLLLQSAKLVPAATLLPNAHRLLTIPEQPAKLRIVVTGGHPGDPECGCGGTIARYTGVGHDVTLLYLNRGEGYCGKNQSRDCAKIRTAEAEKACAILKAHPLFSTQYDGRAIVDPSHYDEFSRLLLEQQPDVVFTHWPTDSHRDHRAISALVLDTWLASKQKFALYYYEVAGDTLRFSATDFVDTSDVAPRHRAACYAHASQQPDNWFPQQLEIIRSYGRQSNCAQAEAFFRVSQESRSVLP